MTTETCRLAFPDIKNPPSTRITYGLDFATACAKHLNDFGSHRAYVLASGGLCRSSDAMDRLTHALGSNMVGSSIGGIAAHTPWEDLIPTIHDMRTKQADSIITLGGGSLTDGAKIIVYALENRVHTVEDLEDLSHRFDKEADQNDFPVHLGHAPKVPIICVPTTLSAGEYTRYAGGVNPRNREKVVFSHPKLYPALLILDPELCLTTPDWVWRSTGARAIDHCVEGICSSSATPESDEANARGLPRLVKSLLAYTRNSNDLDARLESQLGANDAITSLTLKAWYGGSHGIGHQLGAFGVGHGQTSCILLPAVLKFNSKVNASKQEVLKRILWEEEEIADILGKHGLSQSDSDAGDALRAIFNELGMPASLKEVGVGRESFDVIARNSINDHFCQTNPIPLTDPKMILEILETVSGN